MPKAIKLEYRCHICKTDVSDGNRLRSHLHSVHGLVLVAPPSGKRRRSNDKYTYGKVGVRHFSCPSCLSHFAFIPQLAVHINESHTVGSSENSSLVENQGKLLLFTTANSPSPRDSPAPLLTTSSIKQLEGLVSMVTPWNIRMTQNEKDILRQVQIHQQNLVCLKRFKSVYDLVDSLVEDFDYNNWPSKIWNTSSSPSSVVESSFLKASKYILTDYANKCSRRDPSFTQKYERTFWIDRVVPLFQTLGDQTGQLGFEWCEVEPQNYKRFTMDLDTVKRTSRRFCDGIGYDTQTNDTICFESSGPADVEYTSHAQSDALKSIHTTICMLDNIIKENSMANFRTMLQYKVFSVQTIKKQIALSSLQLDPETPGTYKYQQHRTATIPTTFNNRFDLTGVLELLAFLAIELDNQSTLLNELKKQKNGIIHVEESESLITWLGA